MIKSLLHFVTILIVGLQFSAIAAEAPLRGSDKVTIRITGVPSKYMEAINGVYPIADDGRLKVAYLSSGLMASGRKPSQLARDIEGKYKALKIFTNPVIVVDTATGQDGSGSRTVTVAGEVKNPNWVPYRDGMTLLDAVTAANGFTDFADRKGIRLMRNGNTTQHDMRKISENPSMDPVLKPGDKVIVKMRGPF